MCSYTGVGLFYKMQVSFGTLSMGYGPNSHMFPVVFGETGSFYTSVRTYHIATTLLVFLAAQIWGCKIVSVRSGTAGIAVQAYLIS